MRHTNARKNLFPSANTSLHPGNNTGTQLLWNANRKLHVIYQKVTVGDHVSLWKPLQGRYLSQKYRGNPSHV